MEDNIKKCTRCQQSKPFEAFNKCKTGKLGLHNYCRECNKKNKAEWDNKNRQWLKEYVRLPEVKERQRKIFKNKYHNDIEFKKKINTLNNVRRRQEPAKIKARLQRDKWLMIPQNKIAQSLRIRVRRALKNINKIASTEILTGISFLGLKQYLESKFQPGMTWDNYGKWHIDHILPCSKFDLTKEEEQLKCFHYTNLQPLWQFDNISKGNKIIL